MGTLFFIPIEYWKIGGAIAGDCLLFIAIGIKIYEIASGKDWKIE